MDSNQYEGCPKRFRSGDRKRSLSASPDVCTFVFRHALLDITRLIDVTKDTNVVLCNSCYSSFYRKMSNGTNDATTTMDVDYPTKATTCDQAVQTDPILTSCSSAQCDIPIDSLTSIAPIRVNTTIVSDDVPGSSVTLPCYRLANSHKYCGICKVMFGGNGSSSCLTLSDDARMRSIINAHVFVPIGTRCCSTHTDQNVHLTEQSFDLVLGKQKKVVTDQFVAVLFVAFNSSRSFRRISFRRLFNSSRCQLVAHHVVAFNSSQNSLLTDFSLLVVLRSLF
jgi:hypothetical protein